VVICFREAWLKQSTESIGKPAASIRAVKNVAAIIAAMVVGTWMADRVALPRAPIVLLSVLFLSRWERKKATSSGIATHRNIATLIQ